MSETRQIVVPGELVGTADDMQPGQNTYVEGRQIFALRLGVKSVRGDRVNVISLSGRYEPFRGDMVIGTIAEVGPSNWYINIGSANDVGMHVNDVPWRVEFGETSKYLAIGDTVLLKIVHVDEMKKAQVSMKDRQCRKLTGGLLFEVAPTKVPRIVGRQGSMITMIKDATNVRVFVGQNGVIWLDGDQDDVRLALEALEKIEAEAHTTGLTDRMKAWLEEKRPSAQRTHKQSSEDEAAAEEDREIVRERAERPAPARGRAESEKHRFERPAEDDITEGDSPAARAPARDERRGGSRDERGPRREERPHGGERSHGGERRDERPAPRRFEEERPRGPPRDERPAPRRFEEERPRGPPRDERPAPRRFEEERPRGPPRDERPAPRRFEEERPRGPPRDDRTPPRRFEEERNRGPRRDEEPQSGRGPPPRRDDERSAPRRDDQRPPPRRFEEERPRGPSRDDRTPPRRFEEERPRRKFTDEDQDEPVASSSRGRVPDNSPSSGSRFAPRMERDERPRRKFSDEDADEAPASRGGRDSASPAPRTERRFAADEEEELRPKRRVSDEPEDVPRRAPPAPARRVDDEEEDRPARRENDSGGDRQHRGGRGRRGGRSRGGRGQE